MKENLKILILEDSPEDAFLIRYTLKDAGLTFISKIATSQSDFENDISDFSPDIILSDHSLPSFNSLAAINIVKEKNLDIPFILVTGAVSEDFAIQCMKAGMDDYILKSNLLRLPAAIKNIFSKRKITIEKEILKALNNKLEETHQQIRVKSKAINDSINYARRIQKAMLPEKEVFKKLYPQSFIKHTPKDLIGGDFYWVSEHNNKHLIAAADCTGQGIPGALLSMQGYTMINNIARNSNNISPNQIIKKLCSNWKEIFNNPEENNNFDGMEISLCSIDFEKSTIEFSGLGGGILFLGKEGLTEYKGGPGGISCGFIDAYDYQNIENLIYHKISFSKGDSIYLFSDGCLNQLGGEKGKERFTKKRFMDLISSLHEHPINTQKQLIEKAFAAWIGNNKQTHDMLVIGIQL